MLSLGNAFRTRTCRFRARVRKYLGPAPTTRRCRVTAEPKIDGLSLSLRYEAGASCGRDARRREEGENVTANARTIDDIPER
jgi:DNA ligase (NAD+)